MLRTALVGLGRVGWRTHAPNIVAHDGFELVAVVDNCKERIVEAKEKYDVPGYADIIDMLSSVKPDLVVIASPTHLHMEHTIAAFEHGADVFLDKPMACNIQEALKIEEARRKTGKKLMIYQPHRISPEAITAKNVIGDGILKDIYMIKRAYTSYSRRSDWQAMTKYGGGSLFNTGSHFLDQLLYLTGQRIKRIECHTHRIASLGDAPDVVKMLMETDNGVTLDLEISCAAAYPAEPWMILAKNGAAMLAKDNDENSVFRVKYFDADELNELELCENLAAQGRQYNMDKPIPWKFKDYPIGQDANINFYDKCYEYYALNKKPFIPIEETLYVMELLSKMSGAEFSCCSDSSAD